MKWYALRIQQPVIRVFSGENARIILAVHGVSFVGGREDGRYKKGKIRFFPEK